MRQPPIGQWRMKRCDRQPTNDPTEPQNASSGRIATQAHRSPSMPAAWSPGPGPPCPHRRARRASPPRSRRHGCARQRSGAESITGTGPRGVWSQARAAPPGRPGRVRTACARGARRAGAGGGGPRRGRGEGGGERGAPARRSLGRPGGSPAVGELPAKSEPQFGEASRTGPPGRQHLAGRDGRERGLTDGCWICVPLLPSWLGKYPFP